MGFSFELDLLSWFPGNKGNDNAEQRHNLPNPSQSQFMGVFSRDTISNESIPKALFSHVVTHVVFGFFSHLIKSVLPVHAPSCDTENFSNNEGSEDSKHQY